MDFEKYKHRLREYLRQRVSIDGFDADKNPTRCFCSSSHSNNDTHFSLLLYEDHFECKSTACGIHGDIYDAVELLEGITGKSEQYKFIENFFGGSIALKKEKKKFKFDSTAEQTFEKYLTAQPDAEQKIRQWLDNRASQSTGGVIASYPDDIIPAMLKHFYFWDGFDIALQKIGKNTLWGAGIPLASYKTKKSSWDESGVVVKLPQGYKLLYRVNGKSEKIYSKEPDRFPFPRNLDSSKPVVLVEGEMDAISASSIGVENVFATGGTSGLKPEGIKHLIGVPEIIILFDNDEPGRIAAGLDPVKKGKLMPKTILEAGYKGIIKIAEIPPDCGCKDPDELILKGKRDIVLQAIASASVYTPPAKPPKYIPLQNIHNTNSNFLNKILRAIPRDGMEKTDILPFVKVCVKCFFDEETESMLSHWGASADEIADSAEYDSILLIDLAKKYGLSPYMRRRIEKEIVFAGKEISRIKINGIPFKLDFDELGLESNQNAVKFIRDFDVRSAAELLADLFTDCILYDDAKDEKEFYFYDGHLWEILPDIVGVIHNTLTAVLHYFAEKEFADASDDQERLDDAKEFYAGRIRKIGGRYMRREIKQELAGLEEIYHNSDDGTLVWDSRENTKESITFADGTLYFGGKKLVYKKSPPQELRRKHLPYSIEQVKNATRHDKFDEFMQGNFKNKDTLTTFMYYLSLIPSKVQYKYGAFFVGGRNTGKSTTVRLIKDIYEYLVDFMEKEVLVPKGKVFSSGNSPTPHIAALEGLGASIVNETEAGAHLNEALWKSLTGNDAITARALHQKPKSFINTAQIIIQTNADQMPKFNTSDQALLVRMVIIPFLEEHERTDSEKKESDVFIEGMRPEFPAIIRLLAEHYIKLKHELHGVIPISEESESYRSERISEQSSEIDRFFDLYLALDKNSVTTTQAIYDCYTAFLDDDSEKEHISKTKIAQLVKKHFGVDKVDTMAVTRDEYGKQKRAVRGVRIKTADEIEAEQCAAKIEPLEEDPFA